MAKEDFTLDCIKGRGMEDIYTDKQAVWDAIVEEYPMMAYSPIFKEGFDQWNAGGGINQNIRNILGPIINKASKIVTGEAAVGTGYGSHINIQPPEYEGVTERDTHSLVGHEISHLGMKTGLDFIREEALARMHDRMYQPSSYLGTQVAVPYLMDQGYIERIPGGPGYAGGHQYSDTGREFIRTSGLPQEFQRGLGHYEAPNRPQLDQERKSTINWLDSQIKGGQPQRQTSRPQRHHALSTGGLVSLML